MSLKKIPFDVLGISLLFLIKAGLLVKSQYGIALLAAAVLVALSVLLIRGKESGRKLAIDLCVIQILCGLYLAFIALTTSHAIGNVMGSLFFYGLQVFMNIGIPFGILWDLRQSRIKSFFGHSDDSDSNPKTQAVTPLSLSLLCFGVRPLYLMVMLPFVLMSGADYPDKFYYGVIFCFLARFITTILTGIVLNRASATYSLKAAFLWIYFVLNIATWAFMINWGNIQSVDDFPFRWLVIVPIPITLLVFSLYRLKKDSFANQ